MADLNSVADLNYRYEPGGEETLAACVGAAHDILEGAGHVLIGAGAGLSTAAGLAYFGDRFDTHFKNFIDYYGLTDMYSSELYPFPDEEAKWAYWAEHVWMNRYSQPALPLYESLHDYFRSRDCFVLTTNVDAQFLKAGFPKNRVFATQGDYGYLQCQEGCHGTVYPNRDVVDAIRLDTRGGQRVRVSDSALVPRCPVCGGPMAVWLRAVDAFVEDEEWLEGRKRYDVWLESALASGDLVLLELGVGFSDPGAIRFPLERIASERACPFVRLNADATAAAVPDPEKGVAVVGDMAETWPRVAAGA